MKQLEDMSWIYFETKRQGKLVGQISGMGNGAPNSLIIFVN
jgi:hypothetical protein